MKRKMAQKNENFSLGFGERLNEVRIKSGLDMAKFAERLGVSKGAISNYIHGRRIPDVYFLYRLCQEFDINPKWLLFGRGDPVFPRDEISLEDYEFIPCLSEISFRESPRYAIDTSLFIKAWYPFRRDWLRKILRSEKLEEEVRDLFLYPVKDDGMIPTLNPQELVLVNSNLKKRGDPERGRIYLVRGDVVKTYVFRKVVLIKDAFREERVILVYIGDKPDYSPTELNISREEVSEYIIGEALWVGREIKK